jgi:hypothetical protein
LLFSERLSSDASAASKMRVVAADKVLRILEWLEEQDAVKS